MGSSRGLGVALSALALLASGCPTQSINITNTNTNVNATIAPSIQPQLESLEGDSDLHPPTFLRDGWTRAQDVGLVVTSDGTRGTGALVGDGLLLTAAHVLPSADVARTTQVYFGYFDDPPPGASTGLAPDQLFISSGKDAHDWTLVRLAGSPCRSRGSVALRRGQAVEGKHVNIIQHPGGGKMMFASGKVTSVAADRIEYMTSTLAGSSGAPVFDDQWNLVGIHREGDVSHNAGIPIGTILDDLASMAGPQKETCSGT